MNISIFGLGYVGAVVTACLAKGGHRIIGVDTDRYKVNLIRRGKSPIVETGLAGLLAAGVRQGRIQATTDHRQAVLDTELSMICVGTPSRPNGELDLTYVERVCENIGAALREKRSGHIVVARSTMLPGSMAGTVMPTLERASGKQAGRDFGVAINPEFLREGSAIEDFYHPPKTVIGADDPAVARKVASLYRRLQAPVVLTSVQNAEMVKYTDNVFHALKVVFANELGQLCKQLDVDAAAVMDIFCQDQKLNLSPAYLRPGFAYGGSCLPKDLRALTRLAQAHDVKTPLLNAISESNDLLIRKAVDLVLQTGRRRIGVLGFAFKGGTDDLRESPVVALIESLIGKGCRLKLYDRHVSVARLIGANRRFITRRIPHLSRLMVDSVDKLIAHAEVLIIGIHDDEFTTVLRKLSPKQHVIDLTPVRGPVSTPASYARLT